MGDAKQLVPIEPIHSTSGLIRGLKVLPERGLIHSGAEHAGP